MRCLWWTVWLRNAVRKSNPQKRPLTRQWVLSNSEVRASDLEHGGSWVRIPSGAQVFSVSSYGWFFTSPFISFYQSLRKIQSFQFYNLKKHIYPISTHNSLLTYNSLMVVRTHRNSNPAQKLELEPKLIFPGLAYSRSTTVLPSITQTFRCISIFCLFPIKRKCPLRSTRIENSWYLMKNQKYWYFVRRYPMNTLRNMVAFFSWNIFYFFNLLRIL